LGKGATAQEDFYISRKKEGIWQTPLPLGPPINTPENEGAQSISADSKMMVYTVCNRREDYGSCDLYISENKNGKWSDPHNIGTPINSGAWESQPSVAANGDALFFASNRTGSVGGQDIWVSYKQENGEWGQPQNIGKEINTTADETSPFIHPDGQTLYFRSNGHAGMGSFDLFLSRKKEDGSWGLPENLGYPINTENEEGAMVLSLDGRWAFFHSDRAGGKGALDLYTFEMPIALRPKPVTYLKAIVYDADTKLPIVADAQVTDLATKKIYTQKTTDETGEFLVCLPIGKDYALKVAKKDYLFYSENFNLPEGYSIDKPFELKIYLKKIPPTILKPITSTTPPPPTAQQPIILKNVFFETGSADLKPISQVELNGLRDLLNLYPAMRIQINGHTDDIGTDSDNMLLSDRRATSVKNYLIQQGISAARLQAKGFGETRPIEPNTTDTGRAKNRRTEFMVLE
jgi:outer membrane protein OmpA-like peptidoglycan-associated protein